MVVLITEAPHGADPGVQLAFRKLKEVAKSSSK